MRLLIGYDGSENADTALYDLRRAGLPDDADALVLSVADIFMSAAPSSYEFVEHALMSRRLTSSLMVAQSEALRATNEAKEFASQGSDQLRSIFPTWNVRSEAVEGNPADELVRKADEWRADLLVVGSQGRTPLGRLLLGSVSKKVLTNSTASVRVVRSGNQTPHDEPPKIIIGVDGSASAEKAVRVVGSRVWPSGTEIRVVAVDDGTSPTRIAQILPTAAAMITGCNEQRASDARTMVEWADKELNAIGLETSVLIAEGDPQGVLLEEARKWKADSIFVGTREFNGAFERFRLGSVSTALVTKAPCSVEVVR